MKDEITQLLARKDYVPANVPELLRLLRLPPGRQQELQRTRRCIRLGDVVTVQVTKVDRFKKQVDFRLAAQPFPHDSRAARPFHRGQRAERPRPPAKVTPRLKSVVNESSVRAAQRRHSARRRAPVTKVKAQPRQSGNALRRSEAQPR